MQTDLFIYLFIYSFLLLFKFFLKFVTYVKIIDEMDEKISAE